MHKYIKFKKHTIIILYIILVIIYIYPGSNYFCLKNLSKYKTYYLQNKFSNIKKILLGSQFSVTYVTNQENIARIINNSNWQSYTNNGASIIKLSQMNQNKNYTYDAYGLPLLIKNDKNISLKNKLSPSIKLFVFNIANQFKYNSARYDSNTQLQYLFFRFYAPILRRFILEDNYFLLNRFNYVNANPINYSDASGHVLEGKILFVGAGNFSFEHSFARKFSELADQIIATDYQTAENDLTETSQQKLRSRKVIVIPHGVDARNLNNNAVVLQNHPYSHIYFVFPYLNGKNVTAQILRSFFLSAANLQNNNGRIHIIHVSDNALCTGNFRLHYTNWSEIYHLDNAVLNSEYICYKRRIFNRGSELSRFYENYYHAQTHHANTKKTLVVDKNEIWEDVYVKNTAQANNQINYIFHTQMRAVDEDSGYDSDILANNREAEDILTAGIACLDI